MLRKINQEKLFFLNCLKNIKCLIVLKNIQWLRKYGKKEVETPKINQFLINFL